MNRLKTTIKFSAAVTAVFLVLIGGRADADTLGQREEFFIDPQFEAEGRTHIEASLKHISDRAYFYISDKHWENLNRSERETTLNNLRLLGSEFDNKIYPLETEFFGSEPSPGVDGYTRITILLTPLARNAGGYYDTSNNYRRASVPQSNEREMVYLNAEALPMPRRIFGFLAHEFQHLITFNQKNNLRNADDDVWLNELRSEYAVALAGYNDEFQGSSIERRLGHFLDDPYTSLTEWQNKPPDYAAVALFGEYLAEKYSPQVIADTLKNNLPGIRSVNESLKQNGFDANFLEIFRDWLVALAINDTNENYKHGYSKKGLGVFKIEPGNNLINLGNDVEFLTSDNLKDWSGSWYEVKDFLMGPGQDGSSVLRIDFTSSSLTSFYITFIVRGLDGSIEIYDFEPSSQNKAAYFEGINEKFERIIIIPIKKDRLSGFGPNEAAVPLSFTLRRLDTVPANLVAINVTALPDDDAVANAITLNSPPGGSNSEVEFPSLSDGSLIRAKGDYKVYVINGAWRRHVVSPRVFDFYGHLGFDKVIEVKPEIIASYTESRLIRRANDERVYEIDIQNRKRWLNITPEQFTVSGRQWDAIFLVNKKEFDFY